MRITQAIAMSNSSPSPTNVARPNWIPPLLIRLHRRQRRPLDPKQSQRLTPPSRKLSSSYQTCTLLRWRCTPLSSTDCQIKQCAHINAHVPFKHSQTPVNIWTPSHGHFPKFPLFVCHISCYALLSCNTWSKPTQERPFNPHYSSPPPFNQRLTPSPLVQDRSPLSSACSVQAYSSLDIFFLFCKQCSRFQVTHTNRARPFHYVISLKSAQAFHTPAPRSRVSSYSFVYFFYILIWWKFQ